MGLPNLVTLIPTATQQPPLKAPQTYPYASITSIVKRHEATSANSGAASSWWDERTVTIEVWGESRDQVSQALVAVQQVFNQRTTLTYPDTDPQTGLPRFYRYWPEGDTDVIQTPDPRTGRDSWKGTIKATVTSIRAL